MYFDVLSRQARRTAERLGTGEQFPGNFGPPEGEIVGHFKCNRGVLDAPDFGDEFREQAGPATCLAAEDHLQSLALTLVGAFVEEDAHRRFRTRPDVAGETAKRHHIET